MDYQLKQTCDRVRELKKENAELKYLLRQIFYYRTPVGEKLEEYLYDELRLACLKYLLDE